MYCTIIITVTQLLVDYLCNSSHLRELFIPPYFHPYPTRITQDRAHEYPRQEVHFEVKMVCCFAATIMLSLAEFTLEDEQIVSTDKSSDDLFVYIHSVNLDRSLFDLFVWKNISSMKNCLPRRTNSRTNLDDFFV